MTSATEIVNSDTGESFVCFAKSRRIAEGPLAQVAMAAWEWLQSHPSENTLTFDRHSGAVVDLNLNGTQADVTAVRHECPSVLAVSPLVGTSGQVIGGNANWKPNDMLGVGQEYLIVRNWGLSSGEFFSAASRR